MADDSTDRPAGVAARRLKFDRFVLDLERGALFEENNELALRPKTFALLEHLVENAGRLVAKDDLIASVWPDVTVTDDALVQSVGELRRALGVDGPRLIKTVPRRGYRFEADVTADEQGRTAAVEPKSNPTPTTEAAHDTTGASQTLVGQATPDTISPSVTGLRVPVLRLFSAIRVRWQQMPSIKRFGVAAGVSFIVALLGFWLVLGPAFTSRQLATAKQGDHGSKPAIAVLPFGSVGGDPARDYFADGLTQDIIGALGRFPSLTVMSWNAVMPYKGKPASPVDIAHDLGVRYQIEGSVQRTGQRVRVTAQLVDWGGHVLWSGRFDEALADLFALQDKITTEIAGALAIRVTQAEQRRVFAKPTQNLEAYDLVLRARPALQHPARATIVEARTMLRRAIELDPNYAAAYAALGETLHIDVSWGWVQSPATALARAEELATTALRIDDTELTARILLGRINLFYNRYEQAAAEIDRALAVNASDANGLAGRGNILMWLGQTDAAIVALETAQRIDPALNAVDRFSLAMAYYLKRRYAEAIEQAELNLRNSDGANFSYVVLVATFGQLGRSDDVTRISSIIRRLYPTFDPEAFGNKFRNPFDLEHLRDGLRKAGLYDGNEPKPAAGK